MRSIRLAAVVVVSVLAAGAAQAQTPAPAPTAAASSPDTDYRPATNTFFGDTGLWFVPTAEVLPDGKWSGAVYRRGTNYTEGYTNVGDFAGTFAFGLKGRAEIFGSLLVDTRVARNLSPIFTTDPTTGGVVALYPKVNKNWTGDNFGDFYVGAKVNIWSQASPKPAAIAVRGIVKIPTGSASAGVSTGKADVFGDFIVSKEMGTSAELSGYAGFGYLGSPDGFTTPTGVFRWGFGAQVPSRSPVRAELELNGNAYTSSGVTVTGAPVVGIDGSVSPLTASTENLTRATAGVTWQMKHGFFVGGGISLNVPTQDRTVSTAVGGLMSNTRDYVDWQVRIGYHPGVNQYVAPTPAPTPVPTPVPVHTLTVTADANPRSVEVGQRSTVTATVQDSISCAVTYRWSVPTGTLAQPAERVTAWTAPGTAGTVPVTITVTCPTDNKTATASVNIQVTRAPEPVKPPINFEDVYFDFDRYTLRPEALRLLDDAVATLQANPDKNIVIEGHTCNIGTAEYNLALGDKRAKSVRDYLESRGVPTGRMETRSYGEERPKYDNAREETRRLNRRAALVVKVQ